MKSPEALCIVSDAIHNWPAGDCYWLDETGTAWSVVVADGVAYTAAGGIVDVLDELEAA